jgi:hypothetical protein
MMGKSPPVNDTICPFRQGYQWWAEGEEDLWKTRPLKNGAATQPSAGDRLHKVGLSTIDTRQV